MFIHRPDYYSSAEENPELIGLTDIIIAKHRNGEVKDVQMRFRHSEVKFVDTNDVKLDTEMFSNERIETFSSKMNKEEFISNSDFDINF